MFKSELKKRKKFIENCIKKYFPDCDSSHVVESNDPSLFYLLACGNYTIYIEDWVDSNNIIITIFNKENKTTIYNGSDIELLLNKIKEYIK